MYKTLTEGPILSAALLGFFVLPVMAGIMKSAHDHGRSGDVLGAGIVFGAVVLVLVGGTSLAVWRTRNQRMRHGGSITLGKERIELRSGEHVVTLPRASLETGVRSSAISVALRESDGRKIDLFFPHESDHQSAIDAVLRHVGFAFGENARAIVFPLRGTFGAGSVAVLAFFGVFFPGLMLGLVASPPPNSHPSGALLLLYMLILPSLVAFLAAYAAARSTTGRLVIGADAVRRVGGLRDRRIPYDAFDDARAVLATRVVELVRGGNVLHRFPMKSMAATEITAAAARIRSVKYRDVQAPSGVGHLLARTSRPADEWRAWLENQARGAGGFRSAALPSEEMVRVLSDPAAKANERVGAALALREISPTVADAQMHIRVAAEASADPELRRALEAAAVDDGGRRGDRSRARFRGSIAGESLVSDKVVWPREAPMFFRSDCSSPPEGDASVKMGEFFECVPLLASLSERHCP